MRDRKGKIQKLKTIQIKKSEEEKKEVQENDNDAHERTKKGQFNLSNGSSECQGMITKANSQKGEGGKGEMFCILLNVKIEEMIKYSMEKKTKEKIMGHGVAGNKKR